MTKFSEIKEKKNIDVQLKGTPDRRLKQTKLDSQLLLKSLQSSQYSTYLRDKK